MSGGYAAFSPQSAKQVTFVDDEVSQFTGFGTAYLRFLESSRSDRLINDPFAEVLTQKNRTQLEKFVRETPKQCNSLTDLIAIRSRYIDEALKQRGSRIHQVVILGAGLDTRAYRLDALRGCSVLEIDQASEVFDHKTVVLQNMHAPMTAKKIDCIVANLADSDWDGKLLAHGFDASAPTFWLMEGLLPYMERSTIVELLDMVDALSAAGSKFWVDMAGKTTFKVGELGERTSKYGENDPMHGVLSKIPWRLTLQASLKNAGTHFGRKWTPFVSLSTKENVPISFVIGVKPTLAPVLEKEVCPGLEF